MPSILVCECGGGGWGVELNVIFIINDDLVHIFVLFCRFKYNQQKPLIERLKNRRVIFSLHLKGRCYHRVKNEDKYEIQLFNCV